MLYREVSVIIPTLDSSARKNFSLQWTLQSLLRQSGVDLQIIVVDDGCRDETIVRSRQLFPSVSFIGNTRGRGVATARNCGAQHATGDVLVFLDDDMVLFDPQTLGRTLDALGDRDFACGALRYWTTPRWHKRVDASADFPLSMQTLRSTSYLPRGINRYFGYRDLFEFSFIGNFGIVRGGAFREVGQFDESFDACGYEDTELMLRLCLNRYDYALLKNHGIEAIHLNHPNRDDPAYARNVELYREKERKLGVRFKANHFFEVFEDDGSLILEPLPGSTSFGPPHGNPSAEEGRTALASAAP